MSPAEDSITSKFLHMTFPSFHNPHRPSATSPKYGNEKSEREFKISDIVFGGGREGVTASICGWKHLFGEPTYSRIILDSLVWLQKEKRILLFAFVIMPSHLHLILKPEHKEIGDILKDFGSFTAHAILRQLRLEKQEHLLQFFHRQRRDARHQHGKSPIIPITDINEWLMP